MISEQHLGHASAKTTKIYLHVAEDRKRTAIQNLDKRSVYKRMKDIWFPRKNIFILNNTGHFNKVHVGRQDELKVINELFHKNINLIITGSQGIGKSQILGMFRVDKTF